MSQDQSFQAYGHYLVTWNRLNAILDAAIIKETGMSTSTGVLLVGNLTYKTRLGVLRNILTQAGGEKADAVPLLTEIAQDAKRQPMVQGSVAEGPEGSLSFLRADFSLRMGGNVVTYSADEIETEAEDLADRVNALAEALGITDDDLEKIRHVVGETLVKRRRDREVEEEA